MFGMYYQFVNETELDINLLYILFRQLILNKSSNE